MVDIPFLDDLYVAIARALPRALRGYLDPALVLIAAAAIGVLARFTLFRWLKRLTVTTKRPYDDIIVTGLTGRVIAWTILGTLYVQIEELPWRPRMIAWAQDIVAAMLVGSVTLGLMRMRSSLVYALRAAPSFLNNAACSAAERFLVPRNIMCSKKCAKPDLPSSTSLREPVATTM